MTDRFHSLTVVLERNSRDDDVQPIVDAIGMVKGVLSVKGNVADSTSHMAQERARLSLGKKLLTIVYPDVYLDVNLSKGDGE